MTFAEKGELGSVTPISLYIDTDACPVKQEIYRVAERHAGKGTAFKVFVVSNSPDRGAARWHDRLSSWPLS